MSSLPSAALPLLVHPSEQGPASLAISATLSVAGTEEGPGWLLQYLISGEVDALAIPAPATPDPVDGLWRHTCLEAFVQDGDGPGYHEFNLSPSGQWAVYRFSAERQRIADDPPPPATGPDIALLCTPRSLTLTAWLPRTLLPAHPTAIGLSAVVETRDGTISHWALHHPRTERPDFHHSAGWAYRPALPPFPHAALPA